MSIYLDNAATTPVDPRVAEAMLPYLTDFYGNPSSTHAIGRKAKTAIESARKSIANMLNVSPLEIYFTSGGTEADNTFLSSAARSQKIEHAITSPIEHHAVLHTLEYLESCGLIDLHFVNLNQRGEIDLDHLSQLLNKFPKAVVSLMHGNNEIGNLTDLDAAGRLCREHNALFHSDTVQTVGHFELDLGSLPVDSVAASAHKFHGPKGIGIMYVRRGIQTESFVHGGSQERNMRGGTENVAGIIGLATALELALSNLEADRTHIQALKKRMIDQLNEIPGISYNGLSADVDKSLYTVLNVSIPPSEQNDMLLFQLDLQGICASGGSACNSGATTGSHVISALGNSEENAGIVRFSFSKFNTAEEIDQTARFVKEFCGIPI